MGGSNAKEAMNINPAMGTIQGINSARNSSVMRDLMAKYGSGELSFADALNQAGGLKAADPYAAQPAELDAKIANAMPMNPLLIGQVNEAENARAQLAQIPKFDSSSVDMRSVLGDMIATDPVLGSRFAAQEVISNPLTSGLFGKGGIQEQVQGRAGQLAQNIQDSRQALMGRDQSYGLQDSDLQAYAQAASNTARNYGAMEQSLAQSLANRGLASADSGVALGQFAGMQGNKMEQLANAQLNIAQNRINTAKDLATTRMNADLQAQGQNNGMITSLGTLGQQALGAQFGRQMQGSEHSYNQNAGVAGLSQEERAQQQSIYDNQWAQQQASSFNPLGALANVASAGVGALAGGFGTNLGKNLADKTVAPAAKVVKNTTTLVDPTKYNPNKAWNDQGYGLDY